VNVDIYREAFTHRSIAGKKVENNEKLEFVGDALINFLVADYLHRVYPNWDEGSLTKLKSEIVKRKFLNQLAVDMGIPQFLRFNKQSIKLKKGQNRDMFGNAFEALMGAVYIDKGFLYTRKYFEDSLLKNWIDLDALQQVDSNYKGMLFEYAQKEDADIRFVVEESGARNEPVYTARVFISDIEYGCGKGQRKKNAEQQASKQACEQLKLLS
jgi:ribonuclease-3